MDIPTVISTRPASRVRPVLLKVAFATAFSLAAIFLLDCIIHHPIVEGRLQIPCMLDTAPVTG
jgi:hypothetical protein